MLLYIKPCYSTRFIHQTTISSCIPPEYHAWAILSMNQGNVPRRGVVPKCSDLEIVAWNMTSEADAIREKPEADISGFCLSEKKNRNPILPIVRSFMIVRNYAKDTDGLR